MLVEGQLALSFNLSGGETGPEKGMDLSSSYPGHQGLRGDTVRGRRKRRENTFEHLLHFRPSMGTMSFAIILKRIPQLSYYYGLFTDEGPRLRNTFMEAESGLRQACLVLKPDPTVTCCPGDG